MCIPLGRGKQAPKLKFRLVNLSLVKLDYRISPLQLRFVHLRTNTFSRRVESGVSVEERYANQIERNQSHSKSTLRTSKHNDRVSTKGNSQCSNNTNRSRLIVQSLMLLDGGKWITWDKTGNSARLWPYGLHRPHRICGAFSRPSGR